MIFNIIWAQIHLAGAIYGSWLRVSLEILILIHYEDKR
jgi:hypothetical protein